MSRFALVRIGSAALLVAVAGGFFAGGALPARADGYGKFFFSPPDPPPPVFPIHAETVRVVLHNQGAKMIGAPQWRGANIFVIGRDRSGAERRFTLDAETGDIMTIVLVRAAPVPRPPPIDPSLPLGRPLGPPVHPGGPLDADYLGTPPPPQPPELILPPTPRVVVAPPPMPEPMPDVDLVEPLPQPVYPPGPPPPGPPRPNPPPPVAPSANPDAALSPIKPQRPPAGPPAPGAPRVERLPK